MHAQRGLRAQGGMHAQGSMHAGGACVPGGMCMPRGWGHACLGGMHAMHAPPCGQTDTCENITFPNFVCGR